MAMLKTSKKDIADFLKQLQNRLALDSAEDIVVRRIIGEVKKRGDSAVSEYINKFDGIDIKPSVFALTSKEWELGIKKLDKKIKKLIDLAADRLEDFYGRCGQKSWAFYDDYDNMLGNKIVPLNRVLVYAPGGKAVYPSSVLMGAIPAKSAGVKEIILTTPCRVDGIAPSVLYAAKRSGVKKVYKIGGAQAIAGFSFGTKTLPKVDKIVGPGNIYVALAKKLLYGIVDIDMVAGPSEVLIIFDSTANMDYIALDMLSQLEHDENAIAVAVTDDAQKAKSLLNILRLKAKESMRKNIIDKSLKNSAVIVVSNLNEAVNIANTIAPEHLEIVTAKPKQLLPLVTNAGAVFLGENTPEAVGDYIAGPNHILPTGGTARFFSPLGVESFQRRMSVLAFSRRGIEALGQSVVDFAGEEGLFAHGESVKARLKNKK